MSNTTGDHFCIHYNDVIMSAMTSQITSISIVYSFIQAQIKQNIKLRVIGLCVGNSPVTNEVPAQRSSNAENGSIWWRRHRISSSLTIIISFTVKGWSTRNPNLFTTVPADCGMLLGHRSAKCWLKCYICFLRKISGCQKFLGTFVNWVHHRDILLSYQQGCRVRYTPPSCQSLSGVPVSNSADCSC